MVTYWSVFISSILLGTSTISVVFDGGRERVWCISSMSVSLLESDYWPYERRVFTPIFYLRLRKRKKSQKIKVVRKACNRT